MVPGELKYMKVNFSVCNCSLLFSCLGFIKIALDRYNNNNVSIILHGVNVIALFDWPEISNFTPSFEAFLRFTTTDTII